MDNLAYAQERSKALAIAIGDTEAAILARLQKGERLETIAATEAELAALVAEADDAATVLAYYQRLGEVQKGGDIYKTVLQVDRAVAGCASSSVDSSSHFLPQQDADAALAAAVVNWASLALAEGTDLSGIVIATNKVAFMVLEGNESSVIGFINDNISKEGDAPLSGNTPPHAPAIVPSSLMLLQTVRVNARTYPVGIKLHFVAGGGGSERNDFNGDGVGRKGGDPVMDTVLSKCREVIALGVKFAPQQSVDVAVRGGNPLLDTLPSSFAAATATTDRAASEASTAVASHHEHTPNAVPLLLVTLAFRVGVVHSPAVYHLLATVVEGFIAPYGGQVIESFGEHMIVAFDRKGKWPSACLMEIASQLLSANSSAFNTSSSSSHFAGRDSLSAANVNSKTNRALTAPQATTTAPTSTTSNPPRQPPPSTRVAMPISPSDLHVVAHMGEVTFVNGKHCTAFGEGVRQIKALAYVAEASQRPLVISPMVLLHCSRAAYRTIPFSHNTVGYYTFPDLELTRSVQLPDPFRLEAPSGMRVVDDTDKGRSKGKGAVSNNKVKVVPSTKDELLSDNAAAMPKEGADALVEEYKAYYRRLDPSGAGWVNKSTLRQFLLSNEAFVVFPHDAPRIDGWIADAQSLGPERMSLDEFLFLCVRMRQL